jgi:exonuclease SbcC
MKILKLRFANLNSLQGEWEIDFTRPEYVSDGLFAITGPTGSGKSTILDAICLALYGQTPRLGRISRSSNEIMSRHAGDCFAEVTFSTLNGEFRCHWSQHRSRHRRGGELQAQKHEISDASSGTVIQSKVQETLLEVEARTGMDFERFTRSMLLAQGSFAAFLQADPDKRAPVLEQITGTELYTLISIRVHERRRNARELLDRLELESAGIRLLGEEEQAALEGERTAIREREGELNRVLEADRSALHWLQEIARLEEALQAIGRETEALGAEREAFRGDDERLQRARDAAMLEPLYATLSVNRNELQRLAGELDQKERLRPEAVVSLLDAETALQTEGEALAKAVEAVAAAKPVIAAVRQLDLRIGERLGEAELKQVELRGLEQEQKQLSAEQLKVAASAGMRREALQLLRARQEERRQDAALAGALPGIRQALDALRPASEREQGCRERHAATQQALEAAQETLRAVETEAAAAGEAFGEARQQLDQLRSVFTLELGTATLKTLRQELDRLKERKPLLEEIVDLYISGKKLALTIDETGAALQEHGRRRDEVVLRLGHAREILEHGEREAKLLEERARLAATVRSLEEERRRLADGVPCPLCGSTSHPWADGKQPEPDADVRMVAEARGAVQQAAAILRDIEILHVGLLRDIAQLQERIRELSVQREASGRQCLALLARAEVETSARQAEPVVIAKLAETTHALQTLAERIEKLESLEVRIRHEESGLMQRQESLHDIRRRVEQAGERVRLKQLDQTHLERVRETASSEREQRERSLRELLAPYALSTDEALDPELVTASLEGRSRNWLDGEARSISLEEELRESEAMMLTIDARLKVLGGDLEMKRSLAEAMMAGITVEKQERAKLFEEKEPDAEERRLEAQLEAARQRQTAAGVRCNASQQALAVLDTAIADLHRSVASRRTESGLHEQAMHEALAGKGFADEAAFLDARLDEASRAVIEAQAEALRQRTADVQLRRDDRQTRLRAELERRLTVESAEELELSVGERQGELRDLQGRVGAITNRLQEHEVAAQAHRAKQQVIDAQKNECRRWDMLHDLIGSADGKKFRNFAQGITFEIMIAHANRQLMRMTDRYLLLHDPAGPLELSVIDQWQAGEVRSTRNLSGGESFIVSLALALGLSQMSSRNVRVDSLFLDEGFGTLDEDVLETALKTLSSLQQSGKLIGIISHVPALRDRIATHIRVTPLTGGRSAIEGPGTRAVFS